MHALSVCFEFYGVELYLSRTPDEVVSEQPVYCASCSVFHYLKATVCIKTSYQNSLGLV